MTPKILQGDCIPTMAAMLAGSVDLVFGSPPYMDARLYLEDGVDLGVSRDCIEWVAWMLEVSEAAARVCRGPVFWVCAGVTRDRCYWPGPEGLAWEWWKRGGTHQLYRPCVFHRVGICGSGGSDYLRTDWEYVLCLKRPGALAWSDNTAMGHPARCAPGGEMSNRYQDSKRANNKGPFGEASHVGARRASGKRRVNQWGGTDGEGEQRTGNVQRNGKRQRTGRPSHRHRTERRADGTMEVRNYNVPAIANPGNVLTGPWDLADLNAMLDAYESGDVRSGTVGGGKLGSPLAHDNEAAFPEWLAEFFIRTFCPEGGIVLDPFCGSGTTLAVAQKWGRQSIGIDLRRSQVELSKARCAQKRMV